MNKIVLAAALLFVCGGAAAGRAGAILAQGEDRPMKIISKSPPDPRSAQGCTENERSAGLAARLRVTFHSSGKVTDAEVAVSSGCVAFDDETLRVARKIKFRPAVKDGVAVTVVKQVEYSYYRY